MGAREDRRAVARYAAGLEAPIDTVDPQGCTEESVEDGQHTKRWNSDARTAMGEKSRRTAQEERRRVTVVQDTEDGERGQHWRLARGSGRLVTPRPNDGRGTAAQGWQRRLPSGEAHGV